MTSQNKPDENKVSRGRFFGFLGKIGLLSLLSSIPAFAEEGRIAQIPRPSGDPSFKFHLFRSPTIKGKTLSRDALTAKLATKNLENIRDVLTGRFFGKAATQAFKDGYTPMINWNLGAGGGDTGCFFYAEKDTSGKPEIIDNCSLFLTSSFKNDKLIIEAFSNPLFNQIGGKLGGAACDARVVPCSPYCPYDCGADCATKCRRDCVTKAGLDIYEMLTYPADKFVSELTDILDMTDIGTIEMELRHIIFSDEVLNMGLEHFVAAAHSAYEAKILDSNNLDAKIKGIDNIDAKIKGIESN